MTAIGGTIAEKHLMVVATSHKSDVAAGLTNPRRHVTRVRVYSSS